MWRVLALGWKTSVNIIVIMACNSVSSLDKWKLAWENICNSLFTSRMKSFCGVIWSLTEVWVILFSQFQVCYSGLLFNIYILTKSELFTVFLSRSCLLNNFVYQHHTFISVDGVVFSVDPRDYERAVHFARTVSCPFIIYRGGYTAFSEKCKIVCNNVYDLQDKIFLAAVAESHHFSNSMKIIIRLQ
jgi:hypothetical protein